jgi:hypothetical protein
MALQRYDIPIDRNDAGEHFVERYWSPINTPVLDDNGELTHISPHRGQQPIQLITARPRLITRP